MLIDLSKRLQDEGKTLAEYELPEPQDVNTELQREVMKYDPQQQLQLYRDLLAKEPNTPEQQAVIDHVLHTLNTNCESGNLIFIQGMGGSGKSALCKKLQALVRSRGHIALGCAATALAATIYDDFYTAHSLFKYPVNDDPDDYAPEMDCKLDYYPQRQELLNRSKMILWDEWPSNNKDIFEGASRALNEFKGKILIACGDFRQTGPVIQHGDKWQILQASMISSPIWPEMVKFRLTQNLRLKASNTSPQSLRNMQEYNDLILAVGEGKTDCPHATVIQYPDPQGIMSYKIPSLKYFDNENKKIHQNVIDFLFPNSSRGSFLSTSSFSKRAILAATNKQVDDWNKVLQEYFESTDTGNRNTIQTLVSKDELCEADDTYGFLNSMLTENVLNNYNRDGVPPHELMLRVGDICLLQRNLDRQEGLVNNCKVQILEIRRFCIRELLLQTMTEVAIPRIRFKFRLPYGQSFEMIRTQFPLRLAYSLTYNKAQGQSLERAIIDVTTPPFAHGHLYVALSRATLAEGIACIVNADQITDGGITLQNVIYHDLLNNI